MNPAIMNAQVASTRPRVCTAPSALVEENRMKYPRTAQNVAGMKLKKKHIRLPPPKVDDGCLAFLRQELIHCLNGVARIDHSAPTPHQDRHAECVGKFLPRGSSFESITICFFMSFMAFVLRPDQFALESYLEVRMSAETGV